MPWSLKTLPTRIAKRLRRRLEYALLGHIGFEVIRIGRPHAGGIVDAIEIGDDGTLVVVGWSPDIDAFVRSLLLTAGSTSIHPSNVFRVTRPDLARLLGTQPTRMGIVAEFLLPPEWSGLSATLSVENHVVADVPLPNVTIIPYGGLYGNPGVLHRGDIYGVGPPVKVVSSEVLELCSGLEGPLLDFGCGAGMLVRTLRRDGVDARGLELDTPQMRTAADPDAAPFISYYPGDFPTPFADGAFRSTTCCEVLEHIDHYEQALAEIARVTCERLLLTVPDMSGIARGFKHGVIPWHLLEGSHVNFFSQQSLGDTLRPHFPHVQVFRIGEVRCGRMRFYTSLVALCSK